jgi:uncharacterized protein (TIGR02996 family)
MTDRERGFLDAVCADTSDDFPRLIMADWLEDEGRVERAEFIRVQVELARMETEEPCDREDQPYGCLPFEANGKCFPCQRRVPLWRRERELLHPEAEGGNDREMAWVEEAFAPDLLHARPGNPHVIHGWKFRRGFIASVSLTLAEFLTHAKAIFGAAPMEEVRLTDREPMENSREFGWWVRLSVGDEGNSYALPRELLLLLGPAEDRVWAEQAAYYPSLQAAHAALSRACVAYGRDLAGLPALAPLTEAVSR